MRTATAINQELASLLTEIEAAAAAADYATAGSLRQKQNALYAQLDAITAAPVLTAADLRFEQERADAAAARAAMYAHEASDQYDRNLSLEAAEEQALDEAI